MSLFALTSLIAIGGGFALIGNTERLLGLAQDLPLDDAPALIWDVKVLLIILFLVNALFKFIWSHRLFGHCLIVMGAAPNEPDPEAYHRAAQAADIANSPARSFNRGLRSIYFARAAGAWMPGPLALAAATLIAASTLWRRKFASNSRKVLLRKAPE